MTANNGRDETRWISPVIAMIDAAGRRGGFFVGLHEYRPTAVAAIARELGSAFVDFRAEVMSPLGWEAGRLPLSALTEAIEERVHVSPAGLIVHNAEALLATKPEPERRAWFAAFATHDWPHSVVLPIAVFQADLPPAGARLHRVDPDDLPDEALLLRLATMSRGP